MEVCPPRPRLRLVATVFAGVFLLLVSSRAFGQPSFLGPTPYLSRADSPFLADINLGRVYLETFECGVLTVPGVTLSTGTIIPPGFEGFVDSVDGDDGAIDGSGVNGHSLFSGDGSTGITFTFNQGTLGAFPTRVGIVWTDGGGTATFEAFDSMGVSVGTVGPVAIGDSSNSGETAEDRFFGVVFAGGISAIKISNTSGGIEVDHLQYGLYTVTGTVCSGPTPLPTVTGVAPTVTPTVTPTATPTTVAPTATPTTVAPTVTPTTVAPTVTPTTVAPTSTPTAIAPTATPIPIAGPAVPTLSFPMLALLALGLAGAAILLIRGT